MNLWLRLLWLLLTRRRRAALALPHGVSVLRFRVWPQDLDTSLHMNNGRYLTVMDLGRLDLMLRSGLWRPVWRNRWTPVAGAMLVRYRRELRLGQRFRLETRLLGWEAATAVMEHRMLHEGGAQDGQLAARALFKGGFYDRRTRRFITAERVMAELGSHLQSPELGPEARAFLAAEDSLRG